MSRLYFSRRSWAVAAAALSLAGCQGSKAEVLEGAREVAPRPASLNSRAITVGAVGEQEVRRTVLATARITFDDLKVAHIFSPVTGRIAAIEAALGARVKKGQTLATIGSPDLAMALAELNKAKSELNTAQHELQRQKELFEAHAGPQRDFEIAQDNQSKALAEVERAEQKVKLLTVHGARAVGQLFALTSPIDGEIIARNVNPGMEVQGQYSGGANAELFTIGRIDTVWAMADVYEQDIGRVRLGAPVKVKLVAFPDRVIDAKVDWISGTLDPATRTAKVRVVIPNPDGSIKPEMFATVHIESEGRRTLAVPRSSLLHLGEKTMVIAVNGNDGDSYERRPVIVDEDEAGDWVPVLHGLEPGQRIVTSGALLLSEVVN